MNPMVVPTGWGEGTLEPNSIVIAAHPDDAIAKASRKVFTQISQRGHTV
jgi:hypothetical protein